ncbi:hypothetical protein Tco_1370644 [Tanacetum coccineum]
MENSGPSRNQAFDYVYGEAYSKEAKRIEELVLNKQLAKVELFILSEKPLDDKIIECWTDEMIEFYEASVGMNEQNINEKNKKIKVSKAMDDEVGKDLSAHAGFMTQNVVSNTVDASMENMVNNDDADEIKLLISKNRLSMLAVIETRLIKKFVKPVCHNVFGHWVYATNSVDSNKGCRIVVGWDQNTIDVVLIATSNQTMHFEVKLIQDKRSFLFPLSMLRMSLGTGLGYGKILHSKGVADIYKGINDYRNCMEKLDMEDLSMNVVSCYSNFLPYVTSDHCPAMLVMADIAMKKRRSFRFMNYLADKKDFHRVVKDHWNNPVKGFAMFVLAKRLKGMKKHLRELNKKNGNVHDKFKRLRDELKKVQVELDKDLNNSDLREAEMVFSKAYREVALDEEKVLKQKSKVNWLKEGDLNTTYFHNLLKDFPVDIPKDLLKKKVDPKNALYMIRDVSNEEIKVVLFDIEDDKAPGPDGFTSKFFKASWDSMGNDLCYDVK